MAQRELIFPYRSVSLLLLSMKFTVKPVATTPNYKTLGQPSRSSESRLAPLTAESLIGSPPYLLYLSDTALKPSYVTPNLKDLLGIAAEQFVENGSIWKKIIPECDQQKVFDKFKELERSAEISCIHRIFDGCGAPTWVSHHVTVVVNNGARTLCGFIAPIAGSDLSRLFEPSTISSFIHKLGNHFQLLNLALNSLGKAGTHARDVKVIQETLDTAIVMTRAFSEYSQVPAWVPAFEFLEVIEAATATKSSASIDSEIEIQCECDPNVNGVTIPGDPYLLELAVGAVLQNAIEATTKGGKIKIRVSFDYPNRFPARLKLVVSDDGVGIAVCNLPKVMLPFFSTKANHIGLGLSMAFRFIEMHGGMIKIKSAITNGTEVLILLPLNGDVQDACR